MLLLACAAFVVAPRCAWAALRAWNVRTCASGLSFSPHSPHPPALSTGAAEISFYKFVKEVNSCEAHYFTVDGDEVEVRNPALQACSQAREILPLF